MAGLEIFVEGVEKIKDMLLEKAQEYDKETRQIINRGALAIQADAIRAVQGGPKSGRLYGRHQASAPGEAPATDTGRLASNIIIVTDPDGKGARIISRADYSWYLEFGTLGSKNMDAGTKAKLMGPGFGDGRIEPRPFMRPALERNAGKIMDELRALISGRFSDENPESHEE